MVLKMGERCFEDSAVLTWSDADKFKEGDWVLFQRGAGGSFRTHVNGVECYHFSSPQGIKAVVPRPDLVY
jgi:hypothetical protein